MGYIDCDPGQCEFTISGCVSVNLITEPLFGPPHTHIKQYGKSYFLGHISPSDAPGHYLDCVRYCFSEFRRNLSAHRNIPLIVNTMGWNQGLGLCLLKEKILIFQPSHLIQLNHTVDANKNMPVLDKAWLESADGFPSSARLTKPFELGMNNSSFKKDSYPNINYKLISLKSSVPHKTGKFDVKSPQKRFSPKDHRNMAILAYFVQLQEPRLYFKPINYLRPYRVPWYKFALHVNHASVEYNQLLRVFNASLVGLCSIDPKYVNITAIFIFKNFYIYRKIKIWPSKIFF